MNSPDNSGASAPSPKAAFARALSQKDALWRVFFAFNGAIALMIALGDGGFFHTFAFEEGRHDAEFYTAWICGLALGVFAAVFDRMVGADDHLRQRPIAAEQLFWHRQRAMGSILLVWFLAAPLAGWVWLAITQRTAVFEPMGVISAWASFVPAISAAAIGYFGASLPVRWWLRPFVVAAAFLAAFTVIHHVTKADDYHVRWLYVSLHLLAAALFVGLARLACAADNDPDRALPAGVRFVAVPLVVVASILVMSGVMTEGAREFAVELWREYPQLARYQGRVRLADLHNAWRNGRARLCDGDHRRTDLMESDQWTHLRFGVPQYRIVSLLGFREPRWHRGVDSEWVDGQGVYLTRLGEAFASSIHGRRKVPTGIGPEHAPFSSGSRINSLGAGKERILVVDHESNRIYCYDQKQGFFVPLPLPDGDRLVRMRWRALPKGALQLLRDPLVQEGSSYGFVDGEKSSYFLDDGKWVAIPFVEKPEPWRERSPVVVGDGWLKVTVSVPASAGQSEFSHHYSPRTFLEYVYAGLAAGFALGLPPLFITQFSWQLAIFALAMGILLGGAAARRVRRIGGAPADRQLWLWLTIVLGPLGALLSLVFVRPRTYRERPRLAAAPTPRVFTPIMKELAS
ncbi:MAG: hypothetical protein NXI31_12270 [bacterium]|nr:hypothetical protein [bacterium]